MDWDPMVDGQILYASRINALQDNKVDKDSLPYCTPETYGAAGDGVTDDTEAIQMAIDAARVVNGAVWLGAHSYVFSSGLNMSGIREGIKFMGSGMNATRLVWKGTTGNMVDLVNSQYCQFGGFTLYVADPYSAQVGFLLGRPASTVSSGCHVFRSVRAMGRISVAGIYNVASEVIHYDNVHLYVNGAQGAYALYINDLNGLGIESEFETLTGLAGCDTGQTIVGGYLWNNHPNCGPVVYLKNCDNTTFLGTYMVPTGVEGSEVTPVILVEGTIRHLQLLGVKQEGTASFGMKVNGILTNATINGTYFAGAHAGIYGAAGSTVQFSTIKNSHTVYAVGPGHGLYDFASLLGCTIDCETLPCNVRTNSARNTFLNVNKAEGTLTLAASDGDAIFDEDGPTFETPNATGCYKVDGVQVVGNRGAAVADATGAGDVVARLNDLLSRIRGHGLIESS